MNIESGPAHMVRNPTEFGPSVNPFVALIDPDSLLLAHARMSARVACTIHRPLERRRIAAPNGMAAFEREDELDDEPGEECACVDDLLAALESGSAIG
jgi:hypothetical protein